MDLLALLEYKVWIHAIAVGVITVIVGTIIKKSYNLTTSYVEWDAPLFLTGVTIHLLCEVFQLHEWYCNERRKREYEKRWKHMRRYGGVQVDHKRHEDGRFEDEKKIHGYVEPPIGAQNNY